MTALDVSCPYCGRTPGTPCYDYRTHTTCDSHASRVTAGQDIHG